MIGVPFRKAMKAKWQNKLLLGWQSLQHVILHVNTLNSTLLEGPKQ